ncbi:MAG: hypothetical protein Q8K78_14755 [Planctomycetaceae bacterium]|nr:hypothetical protein [Planctomycetaceae bacterium]
MSTKTMSEMTMLDEGGHREPSPTTVGAAPTRSSFWTRYKTLINFWLDAVLLLLFLVQAWLLTVVALVFPRDDLRSTIWGIGFADWLDGLFIVFCTFGVGVTLHVMLHWTWICGTIATRLLGRKATRDDGTQTLLGVGFLIALLHALGAAILAARLSLLTPS